MKINPVSELTYIDEDDLTNIDYLEHLLFLEPDKAIYVCHGRALYGIITLGDFKRHYPQLAAAVNRHFTVIKALDKEAAVIEAQHIFSKNPKIKNIPVVNVDEELIYDIEKNVSSDKALEDADKHYLDNIEWFFSFIKDMEISRIAVIDYNACARNLMEKIKEANKVIGLNILINIFAATTFYSHLMEQYDLVIELDSSRFFRKRDLLSRISCSYKYKYFSMGEMALLQESTLYFRKNQGKVKFYVFIAPSPEKLDYIDEKQRERIKVRQEWHFYFKQAEQFDDEMKEMFGREDYKPLVESILNAPVPVKRNGTIQYDDKYGKFQNIVNGYRITLNKKWDQYKNDLDIYGPCIVFGLFVEDKNTIPSILQLLLNESKLSHFNVNNYGIHGSNIKNMVNLMCNKEHKQGDTVVFIIDNEDSWFFRSLKCNLDIVDLSEAFNHTPEIGRFFIDIPVHCNFKANQLIAQTIFDKLSCDFSKANLCEETDPLPQELENMPGTERQKVFEDNLELIHYVNLLAQYRSSEPGRRIGAIVMNCNPFTKGHRYLAEYASKRVDRLYIFVVEEDRSFFKFADRINLVRAGVADLENVTVIPSGKFIISSITFPGYFQKDDQAGVAIDTSTDIEVFAQHIAPALDIKIRFCGEEPNDYVTMQYNQYMKKLLPEYGIEFEEIPRKQAEDGTVISASTVRKLLQDGNWEGIERLVPRSTFAFLQQSFNNK